MAASPGVVSSVLSRDAGRRGEGADAVVDARDRRAKDMGGAFHASHPTPGGDLIHLHPAIAVGPRVEEVVLMKLLANEQRLARAVGNRFEFRRLQIVMVVAQDVQSPARLTEL